MIAVEGVEFECNVTQYPSFVANLPTLQEPHYVLYTSDVDSETQQPWCPDCRRADPIVRAVIKETGGTLLNVKASESAFAIRHVTVGLASIPSRPCNCRSETGQVGKATVTRLG